MEYEIIEKEDSLKVKIKQSLEEYLEFGERYNQELKLNLKEQIGG